jgi:hypothetical protein
MQVVATSIDLSTRGGIKAESKQAVCQNGQNNCEKERVRPNPFSHSCSVAEDNFSDSDRTRKVFILSFETKLVYCPHPNIKCATIPK